MATATYAAPVFLGAAGYLQPDAEAERRAADLDRQGSASVQARRLQQAKALFTRAITLDPHCSDAYENLALLLMLEGDDRAAGRTARDLLALDAGNYNGRLIAGISAVNLKQFAKALNALTPLRSQATDDPVFNLAYAVALGSAGRSAEAARFRNKVDFAEVSEQDAVLAAQLFREPDLRLQAKRLLEVYVQKATEPSPEALYVLGQMYAEADRKQEARELFNRVIQANPDNVDALVQLSELDRASGDDAASLSHLYRAKTLSSNDPESLMHFSDVTLGRRMYVDARDALQKVVAMEPERREAWYELGLAQFRIGEGDAAEQDFRKALALDEQDEWSRVGLGAVLMSGSRTEEAEKEFRRVLTKDPHSGPAYFYLGEIERRRGDHAAANQYLTKATVYASHDARPFAALGELHLQEHDLPAAHMWLERAIALDPESAAAHYHMAQFWRANGQFEKAASETALFRTYHEEEKKKGILGMTRGGEWDYSGFLPAR